MRPLRLSLLSIALVGAASAQAQAPASPAAAPEAVPAAAPPPATPEAGGTELGAPEATLNVGVAPASGSSDALVDSGMQSDVPTDPAHRTGFTAGLRLGVGIPLGKAGTPDVGNLPGVQVAERDLSDLTPLRAPVWVDLGYTLSGALTVGAYGQVGFGTTGDACVQDCDWSDLRIGAQAELRFLPGAAINPWLGVGLGYEWLSYRQLLSAQTPDGQGGQRVDTVRATERFGGPELLLQGGVDFQVEDALRIGPYASATLAQYLTDSYSCQPAVADLCPSGGSIDGAAFHSWIGVGLRGAYTP
jgi:hypothetical protein